jgi:hypothetical protein
LFTILLKGKKISLSQNPQRKEEGAGVRSRDETIGRIKDKGKRKKKLRKDGILEYWNNGDNKSCRLQVDT